MSQTLISALSDDIILIIFLKLEDDPRNWARLACVCRKFSSLISNICCKNKCSKSIPSIVSDLLFFSSGHHSDPPGGWSALYKLSICCPGLLHAGVLLENSDFGLERELGPDEKYTQIAKLGHHSCPSSSGSSSSSSSLNRQNCNLISPNEHSDSCWSLFDDLYFDTLYDVSESSQNDHVSEIGEIVKLGQEFSPVVSGKRRKKGGSIWAHLASGVWNLSREQGKKLLASRFRGDCLYISDWPGCVHTEEKRKYMLFRGIFKNFKRSQVWRTINDGNRSKIGLDCAFCDCKETWDLHSAFCLRRVFGYHDDGEPVVRAYVCENGHVSGAWTDRPMFN